LYLQDIGIEIDWSQIEDNSDNENDDGNKDEENETNEMIFDDAFLPRAILLNEPRPRRNAGRPERFRRTPPNQNIGSVPLNNRQRNANNNPIIPAVPVVNVMQRRLNSMLAVQNHILNMKINHHINVNDIEEHIDVAPLARLRRILRVVPNIDEIQPYVANPLIATEDWEYLMEFCAEQNMSEERIKEFASDDSICLQRTLIIVLII
jgi:hypothetical protein